MDCFKEEKCSMVIRVQIWPCWKSRTLCPTSKRGGRRSSVSSVFSSIASISDGAGVHKCIQYGQLACFGRHYECRNVYKGLEQHILSSSRHVFQQDNAKPHPAAITTAWLCSRRARMLNWPACSPDLSPIENIWCIIKWEIHQRRQQTLQQLET